MENSKESKTFSIKNLLLVGVAFLGIGATVLYFSEKNHNEKIEAQANIDKLNMENMEQEQLVQFSEIEHNLSEITAHEDIVKMTILNGETNGPLTPQERINQEIAIINDLMQQNNTLIDELKGLLDENDADLLAYSKRNKRLESKVSKFTKKIDELEKANLLLAQEGDQLKEKNILLTSDLSLMESEYLALNNDAVLKDTALKTQSNEIKNLNKALNESFYVVGEYKELKEMDVVEKEGGIIGIGATKELKADFNKAAFVSIDKRIYTTIPVFSKKAELATNHPEDSYRWVKEGNEVKWLEIVNPTAFWESSKYLVVLTGKEINSSKSV